MPGRNRTGPSGHGPGTGRGFGGCSAGQQAAVGSDARCSGQGAGRGRGRRGRCLGNGRARMLDAVQTADLTAEQETAALEDQVAFLETQTDAAKRRISELIAQQEKGDLKADS